MHGREVPKAIASQSVVIHLSDDIDISRGDVIVAENNPPKVSCEFQATFCWTDATNLTIGKKYLLQIGSRIVRAAVKEIEYKLDVNTLEKHNNINEAGLNDIVRVTLKTSAPIVYDAYDELRSSGTAILIDETSNNTVAGCMLH